MVNPLSTNPLSNARYANRVHCPDSFEVISALKQLLERELLTTAPTTGKETPAVDFCL